MRKPGTNKRGTIVVAGLVVIAVAIGAATLLERDDTPVEASPTGAAALTATIDPETGEAVVTSGGSADVTSMSDEGLVEEPSHLPDGGTMVDLQGRFQNSANATVSDSDSVVVECVPECDEHDHGGERR